MPVLTSPWPARVSWALLPLLVGPALGDALAEHSLAVARTGAVLAWGTWAAVLVAVVLPRTVSLTALRVASPAALAAANWAAVAGADPGGSDALAVAGAAVAVVAAFSPLTGEVFVNGSSYGDEVRMPLRVPTPLVLGPIPLAWIASVAAPVSGLLLLAARQWVAGAVVLLVGLPIAEPRPALHGLARRWAVLVPAGLVLHDRQALVEPVLFPRGSIARLGPAPADSAKDAVDLTQGALGLALELDLAEPVLVAPRRTDKTVQVEPVERLLFTPTRPGALLSAARARRIPG